MHSFICIIIDRNARVASPNFPYCMNRCVYTQNTAQIFFFTTQINVNAKNNTIGTLTNVFKETHICMLLLYGKNQTSKHVNHDHIVGYR